MHFALRTSDSIEVEPWPSEQPLFVVSCLLALLLWLVLIFSGIGLFYAGMFGLFFFVSHVGLVAHVRGSAVRLGPDQFPELAAAVERLAGRMGLAPVPEAYLMQGGGVLNAFATKFWRGKLIVLHAELLEACGDNAAARDMIIGHELGHIRAGHLSLQWLLLPARFIPFLGTALSRAREYTCDRYGLAAARNLEGALTGLAILAAGGAYGPKVDRRALVRQRAALNTGWMTLGQWLSTHPPLSARMAALDPALADVSQARSTGAWRAAGILGGAWVGITLLGVVAATTLPKFVDAANRQAAMAAAGQAGQAGQAGPASLRSMLATGGTPTLATPTSATPSNVTPTSATPAGGASALPALATRDELRNGFHALVDLIERERGPRGLPRDAEELYRRWADANPTEPPPRDPFSGGRLGYARADSGYVLWSVGADGESGTMDDLIFDARHSTGAQ